MTPTHAEVPATDERQLDLAELKHRSVRGGLVTSLFQAAKLLIGLSSTAVLARLLSPNDYGVLAMVAAITGFAGLFRDLGLSAASIQQRNLTQAQQSNLFWLNLAFGGALSLAVAAAAPLVAWFYGRPELLLVTVVMSSGIVVGSLAAQSGVFLARDMRFGRQGLAATAGAAVGFVLSLTLAAKSFGYWSLVWGQLCGGATATCMLLALSPFRPGLPRRGTGTRRMLAFGLNVTSFDFANYFARNLDNVLIGQAWGAGPLGLYSRAYALLMFPITHLRGPIMAVAFPALSRLRVYPKAYRAYYLRITSVLAMSSMPVTAFLSVTAQPVIQVMLGEEWIGVAPIFSFLAIAAFVQPSSSLAGSVMLSRGLDRRYLRCGLFNTCIACCSFVVGLPWGATGVALSYSIGTYVALYPWLTWAFRGTPVGFRDFAGACAFPATASILAAFAVITLRPAIAALSNLVQLGLSAAMFAFVLACAVLFTSSGRRHAVDVSTLAQALMRRRSAKML